MIRRIALLVSMLSGAAAAAPIFIFVHGDLPPEVLAGFTAAGARWSSLFSDNVTITIDVGFSDLGSGILGSTSITEYSASWANVRAALTADARSADDATAVAHLQAGPLVALINETSANGGATYLDNNNSANNNGVLMSEAQVKALGFSIASPPDDASIAFNSQYAFDYDPTNGIDPDKIDFVGVATHEIGHALGFFSSVDFRDYNTGLSEDIVNGWPSVLDLYRYSAAGTMDWTVGGTPYFSLDGGATDLARFSTGKNHGNGRQASHWIDGEGVGIMDPTASSGELLAISAMDIRAMDAVGWNLDTPEPAGFLLAGSGLLGVILLGRRRRRG